MSAWEAHGGPVRPETGGGGWRHSDATTVTAVSGPDADNTRGVVIPARLRLCIDPCDPGSILLSQKGVVGGCFDFCGQGGRSERLAWPVLCRHATGPGPSQSLGKDLGQGMILANQGRFRFLSCVI